VNPSLTIRFAMLTGVLLFGGVTWFIRQSPDAPQYPADSASTLLWAARVAWILAIGGCIALFVAIRPARTTARAASLSIAAWALGEMVALFGGVVWFLTGSPAWYVPGLIFLVLTFLAFTGRRAE
jgi:hypothetical protein